MGTLITQYIQSLTPSREVVQARGDLGGLVRLQPQQCLRHRVLDSCGELAIPLFLTPVNLLFSPAAAAAMASTTVERRWMRFEVDA